MSQRPIVYSATWCGHCTRLKSQLDRAQVSYLVVDVDQHPEHLERLAELNGGSWLIPTVELPDGTALVNPPAAAVVAAVKAGHTDDRPVLEQAHRPGSVRASGPTGGG